jgi:putative DNA methylase
MMSHRKKLIEVALPLPEINDASAYDKMPGIGPHPKGIHHWWARLPLPVARAVLFASVVDDPSAHPKRFPTQQAQEQERERLFNIVRRMMEKQLHTHPEIYADARKEMLKACDGNLPPILDPFAGGGSIPLEGARLGFEAHAGDLNPVCVLLNKCSLELVPQWADYAPVNPSDRKKIGAAVGWKGGAGLAADVRFYGSLVLERARIKIGYLYPRVKVSKDMARGRPDLEPYIGKERPVIAWLWARTVKSPNPAARGTHVPLVSTFRLSGSKGSDAWLEPVIDRAAGAWLFVVRMGSPKDVTAVRAGTKTGRAAFRCLLTDAPVQDDYIKSEAKAGRMNTRLLAIVAEGSRGRVYLPATTDHEEIVQQARPEWKPEAALADDPRNIWCVGYGLETFAQLFTPRQLSAIVTLSDSVKAIRADVCRDATTVGLSGENAQSYASTVTTFLALALDRCADFNNSLCRWSPSNQKVMNLFGRQAIPMVWDFAEANLLGESVGAWATCSDYVADCIEVTMAGSSRKSHARQIDAATTWNALQAMLVSTDPPYYDNISYAALSDFFYVWLRRTVGDIYPEIFQTILVPKDAELVAAPERFGGDKQKARQHFEAGFRRSFNSLREKMDPRFPLTVYYAFKQDDEAAGIGEGQGERDGASAIDRTTGWETMLEALTGADTRFQITATWPVRIAGVAYASNGR